MMSQSGFKRRPLPNGKFAKFPESMADEEIDQIIQAKFGGQNDQQMNMQMPNMQQPQELNPSFGEKLAPNVLAGLAQGGHNVLNAPYNINKFLREQFGDEQTLGKMLGINPENIPHQENYNFGQMLGLPQTGADKILQSVVATSPSMLLPGANLGRGAQLISKIPAAGKYLAGATSRTLPQIGYGAAMSENPLEGAEEAALGQAIGETLPAPFRILNKIGDTIKPKQFAKQIGNVFSADYKRAKDKASEYYNPVIQSLGHLDIFPSLGNLTGKDKANYLASNYLNLKPKDIQNYFSHDAKALFEELAQKPNLEKAKKLQAQLGSDAARIDKGVVDPHGLNALQVMSKARMAVKNNIENFLQNTDKDAWAKWKTGDQIFATEAAPYRSSPGLYELAKGERKTITPKQAQSLLTKTTEKGIARGDIPQDHLIKKIQQELNSRINRGQLIKKIVPESARKWVWDLPGMAQNPYAVKKMQQASPWYERLKNSIIASQMNMENR